VSKMKMKIGTTLAVVITATTWWSGCSGGTTNGGGGGGGGGGGSSRTFVYVASGHVPGRVLGFRLNDTSGALTANGSINIGADPRYLSQGRSGLFLFVPNLTDGTVNSLTVHTPNGELTSDALTSGLSQPIETVADANANFVYVLQNTGSINVYSVSGQGALTLATTASTPAGTPTHMVLSSAGGLYLGIQGDMVNPSGIQAYLVDPTTGALTVGAFTPLSSGAGRLLLTPNNSFLVVTEPDVTSQIEVFPVLGDGSLGSAASTTTAGDQSGSLAMNSAGTFLYVGNNGSGTIDAFQFSGSGTMTPIGSAVAAAGTSDLKVDPQNHYLVASNTFGGSVTVYSINGSTGALTSVATQTVNDGPVSLAIVRQQ
jgi:6-phosphogluconolactonase (cycloisomerase 2 family)